MSNKRLTLMRLRKWDDEHDTCLVRELEMLVDAVLIVSAYSPQFWTDVRLDGVKEAMMLLIGQQPTVCMNVDSPEMMELQVFVGKLLELVK